MKQPAVVEIMAVAYVGIWKVRAWFREEVGHHAVTLLEAHLTSMVHRDAPLEHVVKHMQELEGLAAFEVTHQKSGHGVVVYMEWP